MPLIPFRRFTLFRSVKTRVSALLDQPQRGSYADSDNDLIIAIFTPEKDQIPLRNSYHDCDNMAVTGVVNALSAVDEDDDHILWSLSGLAQQPLKKQAYQNIYQAEFLGKTGWALSRAHGSRMTGQRAFG